MPFFKVLLRTKITWMKLITSGARFHLVCAWNIFAVLGALLWLSRGFCLAAFDGLRGTRVVASRLPRTQKSEENGVACCSSDFCSNILGELVASTSRRPSTFAFISLDKEPIDCSATGRPNFQSTRDMTRAVPTLIAGLSTPRA